MALNNDNFARDAVYINTLLLDNLTGLKGHYFTLRASGRDVVNKDENGNYAPKTITVDYVIDGGTAEAFKERLDYLAHLLNRKDADISFNDEYDKFMIGDIRNLGLKEKHATWGLGSYEIVCQNPFKYSKTISEATATKVTDGEQRFTVANTGDLPTQPTIEITPAGNFAGSRFTTLSNLEFLSIKNNANNKLLSIGSSYPDGNAEVVSDMNFKVMTSTIPVADGWSGEISYIAAKDAQDAYYNKGEGLTYKALYPTSYDTSSDTHDMDDPVDTNRTIYKYLSTAMTNFVASYGVRMWANSILAGGSIKLTARTTDSKETGVVIYKKSLDDLKGKVLYLVDGQVMGSDTIDLSQYSHSLGLTEQQAAIVISTREGLKQFFQDEIVNRKRPNTGIVEPKVVGGYVYTPSNNNISFSRLGEVYTFKVAGLPIRRFNYARESGTRETYNYLRIGFKSNMISTSYPNLELQVTDINVLSLTSDSLLNNWCCLEAGSTFTIDPSNLELYKSTLRTAEGVYAPEYVGINNSENTLMVDPKKSAAFYCYYYNKDTENEPVIVAKYNNIYI